VRPNVTSGVLQRAAAGSSTELPQPLFTNVTATANSANGEDFVAGNTRYLAPRMAAAATTRKRADDTATPLPMPDDRNRVSRGAHLALATAWIERRTTMRPALLPVPRCGSAPRLG
jgi:hypothetical protein